MAEKALKGKELQQVLEAERDKPEEGLESVHPEMYMIPGGVGAKVIKNSPRVAKVLDFVGAPLTKKAKAAWAATDAALGVAGYKKGGKIKSSASKRADGIATKGKTKGRIV
jgi:hypothetical protein